MNTNLLSSDERATLNHHCRWGSSSYPVRKAGRAWSVEGSSEVFRTKRDAVAYWEAVIEGLRNRDSLRFPG